MNVWSEKAWVNHVISNKGFFQFIVSLRYSIGEKFDVPKAVHSPKLIIGVPLEVSLILWYRDSGRQWETHLAAVG